MSFQGKLKQHLLVVESLQNHPNHTAKSLIALLDEEGFKISPRTFQRNLESLRDEFGVEVVCNKSFNTYSIDVAKSGI